MNDLTLKIAPHRVDETIAFLEETWKTFMPDSPFACGFLDSRIDQLYKDERRMGRVGGVAAALIVFVACLGLFGLATFAVEGRAKEIGIRKVLGASLGSLLSLLSGEFVRLILVANLIAWPVGYWIADRFLSSFIYRIELEIDILVLSLALGLILALLTVSLRTIRAVQANPVTTLRAD